MNFNNITFSIDLVNAAKNLLNFLEQVEKVGNLYEGEFFQRALYRYEEIWLPMLQTFKNTEKLIPPIDVNWVWLVHMLSPSDYIEDMFTISNVVFDHRIRSNDEIRQYQQYSHELWEKYSLVNYNYELDRSKQPIYKTKIKYDLQAASSRQKAFYYQVSLPHFRSDAFLLKGVERYKKLLSF